MTALARSLARLALPAARLARACCPEGLPDPGGGTVLARLAPAFVAFCRPAVDEALRALTQCDASALTDREAAARFVRRADDELARFFDLCRLCGGEAVLAAVAAHPFLPSVDALIALMAEARRRDRLQLYASQLTWLCCAQLHALQSGGAPFAVPSPAQVWDAPREAQSTADEVVRGLRDRLRPAKPKGGNPE